MTTIAEAIRAALLETDPRAKVMHVRACAEWAQARVSAAIQCAYARRAWSPGQA